MSHPRLITGHVLGFASNLSPPSIILKHNLGRQCCLRIPPLGPSSATLCLPNAAQKGHCVLHSWSPARTILCEMFVHAASDCAELLTTNILMCSQL